jgi:carbonic anhydrase
MVAPALILCCVDYRYIQAIQAFVTSRFRITRYNIKADAGATRMLLTGPRAVRAWLLQNLRLAYERQGVRRVFLFHHQDCLLYGGSQAFASPRQEALTHARHLRRAKQLLQSTFKGLRVRAFYAFQARGTVRFQTVP